MASPNSYKSQNNGGRCGRSMSSYPSYSERRANAYEMAQDPRNNRDERDEGDEVSRQRKRISVACGRCRKRKIRCSGDNGVSPCTNCKNAGYEPCQFLRVASTETHLRCHDSFSYNLEASRQYHSRGSVAAAPPPPSVPQYTGAVALPADSLAYQQTPTSYSWNGKTYYSIGGSWPHGMSDAQPLPYHMYGQSYQGLQETEYPLACRLGAPGAPAAPKPGSPVGVKQEPSYTYNDAPSTTLVHRPATGTEPTMNYPSVPTNMAGPSANANDRVLPTPVGRSFLSPGGSSYRNDSTASTYSRASSSSASGASPHTPSSDVAPGYTSYEHSHIPSYPPTTLPTQLSRLELYSTSSPSDGVFPTTDSMRQPGSAPDMQYRYTDTTTRRDGTSAVGAVVLSQAPAYVAQSSSSHPSYVVQAEAENGAPAENASSDDARKKSGPVRT